MQDVSWFWSPRSLVPLPSAPSPLPSAPGPRPPAPLPLKFIFNSDLTNKRQSRIVCLSVGVSTGPAGRFPAFGKTKKLCPQD